MIKSKRLRLFSIGIYDILHDEDEEDELTIH